MSSGIIFIMLVIGSIPISLFVCWTIYSLEDASDSSFDKKLMENWNCFKWIAYGVSGIWNKFVEIATWKPKTGIDKEIAEEEKEIEELERQKEKMDRLAELKRRKEMLFNEVHDSEVSKEYRNCKYCWGENSLKTAVTRDGISYQICTICSSEQ